ARGRRGTVPPRAAGPARLYPGRRGSDDPVLGSRRLRARGISSAGGSVVAVGATAASGSLGWLLLGAPGHGVGLRLGCGVHGVPGPTYRRGDSDTGGPECRGRGLEWADVVG